MYDSSPARASPLALWHAAEPREGRWEREEPFATLLCAPQGRRVLLLLLLLPTTCLSVCLNASLPPQGRRVLLLLLPLLPTTCLPVCLNASLPECLNACHLSASLPA